MALSKTVAVALASVALVGTGLTTSASAAPPADASRPSATTADEQYAAAQFTCGFHWMDGIGYYGHCDAPPRTDIIIHVEGSSERDMCVKPGLTRLGTWPNVTGAYYTGRLCWAG
jgi:hypothetical protein